jgi:hypothetical protein
MEEVYRFDRGDLMFNSGNRQGAERKEMNKRKLHFVCVDRNARKRNVVVEAEKCQSNTSMALRHHS